MRQLLPPPLSGWLGGLEADSLDLVGTRDEIARRNMCSFSPSAEERQQSRPQQVETFLEAAAQLWADRLPRPPSGPWTFYAWYDEQAGSLRFSLVPGTASDSLPFGARLELLDDASQICHAFVTGTDVIPWSALDVEAPHAAPTPYVLRVFRRQLAP